MKLECKAGPVPHTHRVNATEMAIVIELMQEGYGQTVSRQRVKDGRWVVSIEPVCLSELIPTVARRDAINTTEAA